MKKKIQNNLPDKYGHFDDYGGMFVSETLIYPLKELLKAYTRLAKSVKFQQVLKRELLTFVGRPTPIYYASRISKELGSSHIYLKREDLNHTGAHKINNAMGQVLLAK